MHLDLVDLRLMMHVAQAKSITKGAELSHISLPAASMRIKSLEDTLGVKLLYRTGQGVSLTPAGQGLVQHARLLQAQLDRLVGDMREYSRGAKGHLRVSANTTALGEFLPSILRKYLVLHPDVSLDLRERSSYEIVRALVDEHADIGIIAGDVNTGSLETMPYRSDPLVLVVPREHELADREAVRFEDSLRFDHVGLYEGSAFHGFLRGISEQLHTPWRLRIQVSNFETVCRMTEATVGVSVVPESAARRHAVALAVVLIPLSDSWAVRTMRICARSFDALPAFSRDFVEFLAEDAENSG
jgi:DNA-binding transcriptional LysR family regulator